MGLNFWPFPKRKQRILIVEDDPQLSQMLSIFLRAKGFETRIAQDGLYGVEAVETYAPDCVLLDVTMPRLDGYGVLVRIKADEKLKKIPVLMCTDHNLLEEVERACQWGASGYITKPFDLDRLHEKLIKTLKLEKL